MSRDNSRMAWRNLLFSLREPKGALSADILVQCRPVLCNFRSDAFESTVLVIDTVTGFIATPLFEAARR
jgi:hypothetical protein